MQSGFPLCFLLWRGRSLAFLRRGLLSGRESGFQRRHELFESLSLCLLPQLLSTAPLGSEPFHRGIFNVSDLFGPNFRFLQADDPVLRTKSNEVEQRRTSGDNCVDFAEAFVVVGQKVRTVGRVRIQKNLLCGLSDVSAVEVVGTSCKALLLPRIERVDSSGAYLFDFTNILKLGRFLENPAGIAPADVLRNDAGRPLGLS